jgi:hypothetical protein
MIRSLLPLCLLATLAVAAAAANVEIRMVEASTEPAAEGKPATFPAELRDVQPLLSGNFAFNRYRLLGRTRIALPADGRATPLPEGFSLTAEGGQDNLQLAVSRRDAILLRTTVRLAPGRPVIVGGFNDGPRRILFVLSLPKTR